MQYMQFIDSTEHYKIANTEISTDQGHEIT